MQRTSKKFSCVVMAAIVVIIAVITMLLNSNIIYTFAETKQYSDVLSDLQKDSSFDTTNYSTHSSDYSISVIQLAESPDGELFVYTYTPYNGSSIGKKLLASEVRIATSIGNDFEPIDYSLTLVSDNGTLSKYVVNDFSVKSTNIRYYNVICIFRVFDSSIDTAPTDDNKINSMVYDVSQLWTVITSTDGVHYAMETTETVTITNKHVGFIRYKDGAHITWTDTTFKTSTDAHYVAFAADHTIDKLYEADIEFYSTSYFMLEDGVREFHKITLTSEQMGGNLKTGMFAEKHEWKRIESIDEFKSKENLTDETLVAIESDQWVLRFYESGYNDGSDVFNKGFYYTEVESVSILRLKFETDGIVYNLGVVDNKQSGDNIPDNIISSKSGLNILKIILMIILIVFLIVLLWPLLPFIAMGIVWLLKTFWKVISFPFRAISNAVKKRKAGN